nr:hypothetical protein [Methylosinus sp. RM1]
MSVAARERLLRQGSETCGLAIGGSRSFVMLEKTLDFADAEPSVGAPERVIDLGIALQSLAKRRARIVVMSASTFGKADADQRIGLSPFGTCFAECGQRVFIGRQRIGEMSRSYLAFASDEAFVSARPGDGMEPSAERVAELPESEPAFDQGPIPAEENSADREAAIDDNCRSQGKSQSETLPRLTEIPFDDARPRLRGAVAPSITVAYFNGF